jgi:acetylornithine deacetylase/succinyl-diaminopimelate desuccinylase-like protein
MTVLPELQTYFNRLHRGGVLPEEPTEAALSRTAEGNHVLRALLTNTVSVTGATAGVKHNVIPGVAEATLDCRLLPGQDAGAFIEEVRSVIDDPDVQIERVLDSNTPSSPVQTQLFDVVEEVMRDHIEEALVAPTISPGFTYSRVFRKRGVVAYGFIPILLEPLEAAGIHGHNERLSIENLRLGTQTLFEVTRRLCT